MVQNQELTEQHQEPINTMEMKSSMIYMLIANLWLMLAWIVKGQVSMLMCLILGFLWLLGFIYFSHKELEIDRLDFCADRMKFDIQNKRYHHITLLLEALVDKKGKKK